MKKNRVFKTASLVCLIVFVLSVAYMLAIVRLRYHFESTWNILPVTYAHCVAWPLCALSGIALPLLLSKGEVCLPGWLRILLAAAGRGVHGPCLLGGLWAQPHPARHRLWPFHVSALGRALPHGGPDVRPLRAFRLGPCGVHQRKAAERRRTGGVRSPF